MGVPAFFRWLSRKYPSIVVHCREEKAKVIDGVKVPVDITGPNPNGFEFDNLYLDMNGIIHPCCHPENKPAPATEDEMMEDIFEYIDRLVAIVRPRKVLYMAIDGVAPRAKMNQQRSRRFRSSKDSKESREALAKVKEDLRSRGVELPPDGPEREHFDSNCITPGTEFMARLAVCLIYYIHVKMNTDPGWSQLMVVLSDANVPGEGEHKIMDFIRRQRSQPDHDPNTRHCLCGADADLIMLGLATHEPNFTIIREEFKPFQERPCEICAQTGHKMTECTGAAKEKQGEFDEKVISAGSEQDFIFLRLNVLREYLSKELAMINLPFKEDFERAIDDWVLMCFFVGNDFLPHLPSLEIREGAIDRLIGIYKKVVYKTGGYLTDSGHIHLDRVQLILENLGEVEDEIFKKRRESDEHFKRRNEERKRQRQSYDAPAWIPSGSFAPVPLGQNLEPGALSSDDIRRERQQNFQAATQQSTENQRAASDLRRSLGSNPQTDREPSKNDKKKVEEKAEEPKDDVRLWEDGWKDRYYMNKFGVGLDESSFRTEVANQYMLGICWVLKYYYQGCASWNWYFPYHYAPFASDFIDVGKLNLTFPKDTKPFNPLEQLMSVFPAASKKFLPPSWQELMYRDDSKIIDFYPTDFKIDLNGKKQAWQGVALLPFVDESRLLKNLGTVYPNLTEFESKRNSLGNDRFFVHKNHKVFSSLVSLYEGGHDETKVHLNPELTGGIAGLTWCDERVVLPGDVVKSPLPRLEDFACNQAICVKFLDPRYDAGFIFPAKLLPKAQIPPATLNSRDNFDPNQRHRFQNDREYSGSHDASAAKRMLRGSLNPHGYNVPNNNKSNWNSDRPRNFSQPYDNFSRPHLNPPSYNSYEHPPPSGYEYNQGPPRGPHMGYGQRPPYYSQRDSYQDQNFRNDRRNNHPRFHPYSRQH